MPLDATRPSARVAVRTWLATYLARTGASPLVIAVVLIGVLLPTMTVPYAFSDDYAYLWMASAHEGTAQFGDSVMDISLAGGRGLTGVFTQAFYGAAHDIDHLRYVRVVGVLGIVVLGLLLQWTLMQSGVKRSVATLLAIAVCLIPSFQVYAAWTNMFTAPWAAVLGALGSMLATSATRGPLRGNWPRILGAVAALLGGLWLYQPAAMFFWVFGAVALFGAIGDTRRTMRIALAHLVVAGGALVIAFMSLKLTIAILGADTPGAGRSALSYDVIDRLHWFAANPLYQASSLYSLNPSGPTVAVVGTLSVAGMLLWFVGRSRRPLLDAGIALALVPLSFLPNLVTTEEWAPFRTQPALAALLVLYASLGMSALWLVALGRWRAGRSASAIRNLESAAVVGAAAVVALVCFIAARNVSTLIVDPQMTELRMLRAQIRAIPADAPRVVFVDTDWYGGMTSELGYDEFGLATTTRPWALVPVLDLILRENGRPLPAVDRYNSNATVFPAGVPVIDVRWMRRLR